MKLELFYPIKPVSLNQIFGVNPDTYKKLGLAGHNGVDLWAAHGQIVRAAHDGKAYQGIDSYEGHGITVVTNDKRDYKDGQARFKTIYWHLLPDGLVEDGKQVFAGDILGYADSTGFSTGNHLHFGLKPIDDSGNNIEQNNGFLGAIDPVPYFNQFYAEDAPGVLSMYRDIINKLKQYINTHF